MSIARAATRFAAAPTTRRAFAVGARSKHTLPDLPYDYNALEPAVSGQIMELHHAKHHQTYVNALNAAEEQLDAAIASKDLKKQIQLQSAINFNGGGHLNHTLFWEGLKPEKLGGGDVSNGGSLAEAIKAKWGDLDALKKDVNAAAAGIQGSGWAWVALDPKSKELVIATTANQDPLVSATPLFGIDMWEHAFYLQHQNRKPDYLANIWRVINFDTANKRYEAAKK